MTDANDIAYYRERAAATRRLAERANDPAIAAVHREMAALYDERVTRLILTRPRLTIVAGS